MLLFESGKKLKLQNIIDLILVNNPNNSISNFVYLS